jgi:hypothetical protein
VPPRPLRKPPTAPHDAGPSGYLAAMRDIHTEGEPIELEDVPSEEDLSTADAADRLDEDPDAVPNRRDVPDDAVSLAEDDVPEDR